MTSSLTSDTPDALLARGNECFVNEDYLNAHRLYSEALHHSPSPSLPLLLAHCTNALKLRLFTEALHSAEEASRRFPESSLALLRKGAALFELERYKEAQQALLAAQNKGLHSSALDLLLRKCEVEMKTSVPSAPSEAADEATVQPEAPPAPSSTASASASASESTSTSTALLPLADKVKEEWFQNRQRVTITLLTRNLPKGADNIQVEWLDDASSQTESAAAQSQKLQVRLVCSDGSIFQRVWTLFAPVQKDSVKTEVTPYKLEIVLEKCEPEDWLGLCAEDKAKIAGPGVKTRSNVMNVGATAAATAYPSSSKKKTDFNEVEQTAKELEEAEKPTGDAALQKLFQSIYKGADEDTRRAMIKSFQTSGGTVLSTNWKEVKEKDYTKDRQAPAGQEFVNP